MVIDRVRRAAARWGDSFAARGVAPESATLAALVVSVAAGVALAAGGAAGDPRLWVLVPSLGLARLALHALEMRLLDCRAPTRRAEEIRHGDR